MSEWPKLGSPEDADATHRWARKCVEMWERERVDLRAERDRYRELLLDVADAGVAFDDERLKYVEVQIDRATWDAIATLSPPEEPQRG